MTPLLLTLALMLSALSGGEPQRARVAGLWNRFTVVTNEETEADLSLQKSLHDFNPAYLAGPYEPRRELLDEAIRLSDERTKLLRQMRDAEFGQ